MESFATESISPYSFYKQRNFGNNLSRYIDAGSERINHLLLSSKDYGGEYSIKIDECILDKQAILPIKGSKNLFTYHKTIYFTPNSVAFRFQDEDARNNLITESQILFEVKCIEKYMNAFYVKPIRKAKRTDIKYNDISFSFKEQECVMCDNLYNSIKGAIIGFVRGQMTSNSVEEQSLLSEITNIKNSLAGLYTEIMMGSSEIANVSSYIDSINRCKGLYNVQIKVHTNLFDILLQQFSELVRLSKERSIELLSKSSLQSQNNLINERNELYKQIADIEGKSNLSEMRAELSAIKNAEKENGRAAGQSRLYYRIGTLEREKKDFLKSQIKQYETTHPEYTQMEQRIKEIDDKLSNTEVSIYDTAISAIFIRTSDIINDIIKKINSSLNINSIDLDRIFVDASSYLRIEDEQHREEIEYFNILISYILHNPLFTPISDMQILHLVEESAKIFKQHNDASTSNGKLLIQALREFWLYKQQRSSSFSIPEGVPIFQSIMAFFVKPFGFDQMERFMLNKHYSLKAYGFMLWGACKGYADLPKTFTNVLYNNKDTTHQVDVFLRSIQSALFINGDSEYVYLCPVSEPIKTKK